MHMYNAVDGAPKHGLSLCSRLAELSVALGDLPHVPLLGHPSQPEPLLAAARASGIGSFDVCFLLLCMLLFSELLLS